MTRSHEREEQSLSTPSLASAISNAPSPNRGPERGLPSNPSNLALQPLHNQALGGLTNIRAPPSAPLLALLCLPTVGQGLSWGQGGRGTGGKRKGV